MNEHCQGCRFWMGDRSNQNAPWKRMGLCRRFPPSQNEIGVNYHGGAWVRTASDDWCGEFQHDVDATPPTAKPETKITRKARTPDTGSEK